MSAVLNVQDVLASVEFEPVKGHPQVSVIRLKSEGAEIQSKNHRDEMTEEDWDKFEKDIEDAFEQVP